MDRIEPIRPRPPRAEPVPPARRTRHATDQDRRRERDEQPDAQDRPGPGDEPPDDGRPHIDIRV